MMETYTFFVEERDGGARLDGFLAAKLDGFTRSRVQRLVEGGHAAIDASVVAEKAARVKPGQTVVLTVPDAAALEITPYHIPLDVVYEDSCMLVVNKPQGMVVHPAAGNQDGTLVNALLAHCGGSLSGINGVARPGILHRIDKDTSGLLLVAKNDDAHLSLAAQIKAHSLTREYAALLRGSLRADDITIDKPIGRHPVHRKKMAVTPLNSKNAVTHIAVIERFDGYTFVKCRLQTGRTHQIRVHAASMGHPVAGDATYGAGKEGFETRGQLLHAQRVGFIHPQSGEYMEFYRDVPDYFGEILASLRKARAGVCGREE